MKHRLWTDALREVKGTFGRFLSLLLLSALAVSFLAGLRTTAPVMERSADSYYDLQHLMDVRVLSTLGITDGDILALSAHTGVEAAEGAYTIDAIVSGAENDFIVKVLSITAKNISLPRIVTGRMPQSAEECLVEPSLLESLSLSLGDTIELNTGSSTYEQALARSSFTVVGTANSPLYVSQDRGTSSLGSGRVSALVMLPMEAFTMDAYTDAYLIARGAADLLSYSDAYETLTEDLIDSLEPLGDTRAGLRYDSVIGEATTQLSEAQQEFDDAETKAARELEDARLKLTDARQTLNDGWRAYRDGKTAFEREIADAEAKILQAETVDLPDALRLLEEGEADYKEGLADYAAGEADYAEGVQALKDAWKEYEAGLTSYQEGLVKYRDGYNELVVRDGTYSESLQTLKDGEAAYAAGVQQYTRGLDQLQEGGRLIQENERTLQQAQEKLFEGGMALSAGQSELDQQSAAFSQLVGGHTALLAAMAAGGMDSSDPAVLANQVGAILGQAVMTGGQDAFFASYVDPLASLLGAAIKIALIVGTDASQLETVRAALPVDGSALALAFGADPQGFITAYLTALGATGATTDAMKQQLEAAGAELSSAQTSLDFGEDAYSDGMDQLVEAKTQFYASNEELTKAGQTLAKSRKELDDGWGELREGGALLDDAWATLGVAKTELTDADDALADGWKSILDGQQELDNARKKLEDAQQELTDARRELDDGWAEYQQGLTNLEDAKDTLAEERPKGLHDLRTALAALEDGETEYEEGLANYHEGKRTADEDLSDARRKLNDARREIADIEHCTWYLLGRNTNVGYASFQQDAQRMGNLASVFPLIFFLVAALVCLTTMTRMVEEHRVQIGGLKALGYGPGSISIKYVGYGLGASLTGGLLGLAFGCTVIPWIIYTAWTILYTLGPLKIPFYLDISLLSVGAAVLTVVGAAWLTCRSTLREVPASLMRPKAPKAGKRVLLERIGPLWQRLSFTQKVTVRNLFRYQRRFWMTVVGIGGCTALIVTGFGLRDSIFSIMDVQYDELYNYTSQIGLVDDVTDDELKEVCRALDKSPNVSAYLPTYQEPLTVESGQRSMTTTLLTSGTENSFGDFILLRHRIDHQPVTLPAEGAVLNEKLAALLKVGPGDEIVLDGEDRVTVKVADVTEQYIAHYVYLSPAAYAAAYGETPRENLILARYREDSRAVSDAVSAALIPLSGVTSASRITDTRETYQQSLQSVDYAVVVVILSAAALAFVVLFNLTNINITERMRELATLKVLGFRDPELAAYVFRENALLTLFGILMGLVMGKFLHQWLVLTVEIDMLMFGRFAEPLSYLYAVLLTVLFSVLVNLVASRKLKTIDMVESLKTVE